MEQDPDCLLTGQVEVDEFRVGGSEEGRQGRSKGKKREVVLAIKTSDYGIHKAYAQVINGAGTKELRPFFERYIAAQACIKTAGWPGYSPLKASYPFSKQYPSKKGKSLQLTPRYILMFKAWLRGIHHSVKHLQVYLCEYNYRFNMIKQKKVIFHDLITKMVKAEPIAIPELMRAA
ncbi:MAG: IS1595 family transposase [Cytophagales bacterium]|nr:IS1595 family transposase [Cytophagales bacterium]